MTPAAQLGRCAIQSQPAFDLASIAGLQAWYKADAGVLDASDNPITVDGTAAKTWQDQSGNNRHLTQATAGARALWKAAIQNSLPVMRFDGADDRFSTASLTLGTAGRSIFVVCSRPNWATSAYAAAVGIAHGPTAGQSLFVSTLASAQDWVGGDAIATGAGYNSTQNPRWVGALGLTGAAFHVINSNLSAAAASLQVDGVALTPRVSSVAALPSTTAALFVGDSGASNFFTGDLGEVLVYDSALAAGDIATIFGYLKTRWGTP